MADRARAHVNLVAERLLALLQEIGRTDLYKWLTTPRTIEMMTGPGDLKKARPGIFLEVVEVVPDPGRGVMGPAVPELASFLVHCTAEDVNDPSGACHDLMADVERKIRENRQLGQTNGVLKTGTIKTLKRKASIQASEGGSGLSVGFVEVEASYLTSSESP